MTVAHPIARAWLTTGGTSAQNYDEFADESEITDIIADNPVSALAIEMPHRAPENVGRPFRDCLPDAVAKLSAAQADQHYTALDDVAALYRITGRDGARAYGLWCMVDTAEISTSVDEPGLVIRNEDVFAEKVRERVALVEATGHLLSPVLLLQTAHGEALHAELAAACDGAGTPSTVDLDGAGRTHDVWPIGPGPLRDRLLDLAGGGELVVADGNHRSLAAQYAGLDRFLAVVTTPDSVAIEPYNRLVAGPLPDLTGIDLLPGTPTVPASRGRVRLYTRDGAAELALPVDPDCDAIDNLDHAVVERWLFGTVLGLAPGDKRVTYVGGDYPASWLCAEVDAGRADLAILIAPVTVEDFVAVNLARRKMPRKSTWFTPKARAGLVVAELP